MKRGSILGRIFILHSFQQGWSYKDRESLVPGSGNDVESSGRCEVKIGVERSNYCVCGTGRISLAPRKELVQGTQGQRYVNEHDEGVGPYERDFE